MTIPNIPIGQSVLINPITVVVATAGTQQQVSATDRIVRGVWAKARVNSTTAVVIGDADVSVTNGFELPETAPMWIQGPLNLADLWVDVATNGEIADFWPVE